jgi:hypothetical protein
MHVRHEALFRWIDRTFPGGRIYGPYTHGGRNYLQWMARGAYLRDGLLPVLERRLSPDLDGQAWDRFVQMRRSYARQLRTGEPTRAHHGAEGGAPAGPPSTPPDARRVQAIFDRLREGAREP